MSGFYTGTIALWPLDWAPAGWELCRGQSLPIKSYEALYAIIGRSYGGDGRTTFNLPNLQGRTVVGMNTNDPENRYSIAESGGTETVKLYPDHLPVHTHVVDTFSITAKLSGTLNNGAVSANIRLPNNATTATGGTVQAPAANRTLGVATTVAGVQANIYSTNVPNVSLKDNTASGTGTVSGKIRGTFSADMPKSYDAPTEGGGNPLSIMQPYFVLNYIICVRGEYYPSRD